MAQQPPKATSNPVRQRTKTAELTSRVKARADSPDRDTRFKPGQSGNPNGRPRKERSLLKLIEVELDAEMQVTEGGRTTRLTKREALAKAMVHNALKGDHKELVALLKLLPPPKNDNEENAAVPREAVLNFLMRKGSAGDEEEAENE